MNKIPPVLAEQVSQYWATYFGCSAADLESEQTLVVQSAAYRGLVALSKGPGWVVGIPAYWGQAIGQALAPYFVSQQLPNLNRVRQVLASCGDIDFYGPARIFLQPRPPALSCTAVLLRPLQEQDLPYLDTFAAEMGELAWAFGEGTGWLGAWGAFVDQHLVSVCAVRVWGEFLAEIYIDTLPAYRHRGYGKAVTTVAVQWVQTHTPYVIESVVELVNESSLALMASLHFKPYGYLLLGETMTKAR